MMHKDICICNCVLAEGAHLPEKKHPDDAGYDVYANEYMVIHKGERAAVGTGLFFQPDSGWYIQVVPRSGLALKSGITVLNTPGTVDSNYRNEIKVILANFSDKDYEVHTGDRIAQLIFTPSYEAAFFKVDSLDNSDRGKGGFGSTGQ